MVQHKQRNFNKINKQQNITLTTIAAFGNQGKYLKYFTSNHDLGALPVLKERKYLPYEFSYNACFNRNSITMCTLEGVFYDLVISGEDEYGIKY